MPAKKGSTHKSSNTIVTREKNEIMDHAFPEDKSLFSEDLSEQEKFILKCRLRNMSQKNIATLLNVSQPYIAAKLKKIREYHLARGTDISQAIVTGETMSFFEELEKSIWDIVTLAKSEQDKNLQLKALNALLEARKGYLKTLQEFGLIKQANIAGTTNVLITTTSPFIEKLKQEGKLHETSLKIIESTHEELEAPEPPVIDMEESYEQEDSNSNVETDQNKE